MAERTFIMSSYLYCGSVRLNPENQKVENENFDPALDGEYPCKVPKVYFEGGVESYFSQYWDNDSVIVISGKRIVKYTKSSFIEFLAKNEEGESVWMDGRRAPYSGGCWKGAYLNESRQAHEYTITEYDLETYKKKEYKVVPEEEIDIKDSDLSWLSSAVGSEFEIEDGVLLKYRGWKDDIVIPEGVKEISSGSLFCGYSLNSIKIPNTVEKISFDDFPKCNFKSIEIAEDNPRYLSKDGFVIDKQTKTLMWAHTGTKIPDDGSVVKIASNAFYERYDISYIVIPDTILELEDHIFNNGCCIRSIEIPDSFKDDLERIFSIPSEFIEGAE